MMKQQRKSIPAYRHKIKNKKIHEYLTLSNMTYVFTIISITSIFFGWVVIYLYLNSIGQTAIFPDLISSGANISAIFWSFLIKLIWFNSAFIFIYFIPKVLKIFTNREKEIFFHITIIRPVINNIVFLILFFVLTICIENTYVKYGVLYCIAVLIVSYMLIIHNKVSRINKGISNKPTQFILLSLFLCLSFLIVYNVVTISNNASIMMILVWFVLHTDLIGFYISRKLDEYISFLVLFMMCFLLSLFGVMMYYLTIVIENKWDNELLVWIILIVIDIFWLFCYYIHGIISFNGVPINSFYTRLIASLMLPVTLFILILNVINIFDKTGYIYKFILNPFHFIEQPYQSNWYTVDTRFFASNNLSNQEIERYSKNLLAYFYSKQFETQCKYISEEDTKKQCEQSESEFQTQQKYNRFYGYVAWNLGEMKVFCPHGYEQARLQAQKDNKEKKRNPIQCLALKSEYIIPYY